ncbi:MAG: radical SAM protein [Azoarcus sp.]|jgi:MoaA/NifB/PqqE/SkfB family radical SAM enzyme|nr:radical SAM protein [Azoarcus sp.]
MKRVWNLVIRLHVFFHYLPRFIGRPRRFLALLGRLDLLLNKLQHNKFAPIGKGLRLDLYVPSYPGKAFFKACDKFCVFDGGKSPCTGVLLSVTNACPYACEHCYQRFDTGRDVDIALLTDTAKRLQAMGVCFFNIEGGEPFVRYERLKALCAAIDCNTAEIWVNSTGHGMTAEKLRELRPTAVMFSLHSADPETFNGFMGRPHAWKMLMTGIAHCKECGIPFAFNACLMEEAFFNREFERVMALAKDLGACLVQIIKPKPAGAWLAANTESMFSERGVETAIAKVNLYNLARSHRAYPPVSAQILEEAPDVFGCTAGGTDRFYINAKGDVQPCEFLNISFGNIAEEDFGEIYARMRKTFRHPGTCMLCEKAADHIHKLRAQYNLERLPLPPELSREVHENWDKGARTALYEKTEKRIDRMRD